MSGHMHTSRGERRNKLSAARTWDHQLCSCIFSDIKPVQHLSITPLISSILTPSPKPIVQISISIWLWNLSSACQHLARFITHSECWPVHNHQELPTRSSWLVEFAPSTLLKTMFSRRLRAVSEIFLAGWCMSRRYSLSEKNLHLNRRCQVSAVRFCGLPMTACSI